MASDRAKHRTGAPAVDIAVDAALVRRLVDAQFPRFTDAPLDLVANGWDNVLFRLGNSHGVRLPRRTVAAHLVEHELRWLPVLSPHLPIATPAPIGIGRPTAEFPWHWSIVPWFDGVPASELEAGTRAGLARPLAAMIAALVAQPVPVGAPHNPVRGVALAARDAPVRERISRLAVAGRDALQERWDRWSTAPPWHREPVWLHGDLHPGNMIARSGPAGTPADLCAIIDFGDLTVGDPATDLATTWITFGAAGRTAFVACLAELGVVPDAATWDRARAWALIMGSALVGGAGIAGDTPNVRVGRHVLGELLRE